MNEPLEWVVGANDAGPRQASVLELVANLLDHGCVIQGELILGLADIDLIYVELSALLCAADRLTERPEPT